MPNDFITQSTELLSGTGVVGGIVALATTFGWWLRRERSEKAKTGADVSASNAAASASDSQAKQIQALTKRANEQDLIIDSLKVKITILELKVARLEAGRVGSNLLLPAIKLCSECKPKYQPFLDEIGRLLADDK